MGSFNAPVSFGVAWVFSTNPHTSVFQVLVVMYLLFIALTASDLLRTQQ